MSRARNAAISSFTETGGGAAAVTVSILGERQEAAKPHRLQIVDVCLRTADVAIEVGLEGLAFPVARPALTRIHELRDVRAVLQVEARARERMSAERRPHHTLGEERGALRR